MNKKSIQIVGSFISNYSLARVNRGLAKALSEIQEEYSIHLYREKDKIDRWPNESDLIKYKYIKDLWSLDSLKTDIAIYNDFPKTGNSLHGFSELNANIKLMYLAWEESVIPKFWIDEMNQSLNGVIVASSFVRDILRNNGCKLPIKIALNALDDNVRLSASGKYELKTKKKFKFLHISSAKKRKGVDILIESYFKTFTNKDDVCLVIKSFPGPDNIVNELINKYQTLNSPEIEHIFNSELTDQELVNLILTCDVGVYPSRAEGFGLPIAESMFHKIPVIATNYSAYLDFANKDNTLLIDYKLADAVDSELVNIGAKWAEPNSKDLSIAMNEIYRFKIFDEKPLQTSKFYNNLKNTKSYEQFLKNAKTSVNNLKWENTAKEVISFIKDIEIIESLKKENFAVITPFNSKDGISEYSKKMYPLFENVFNKFYYLSNIDITDRIYDDGENVYRTWNTGEVDFFKTLEFIKNKNIKLVDIQYHSGTFFSTDSLDNLVFSLVNNGVKVRLILHAVKSKSFDFIKQIKNLRLFEKVIIHNKKDYEYAKNSLENVEYLNHPIETPKLKNIQNIRERLGFEKDSLIISTHGLMNSNKNIPNIVEAFSEVKKEYKNSKLLLLNAVIPNNFSSFGEYEKTLEKIDFLGLENDVRFITQFLDKNVLDVLLQIPDLFILAYAEAGESASGAVKTCMASGKPVIVTDIPTFEEFKSEVLKISDCSVEQIKSGINQILKGEEKKNNLINSSQKYISKNSFELKSLEFLQLTINH